ncbi:MAG: OmpP1/FadL family transporter [Salinivenus sp.]
MPLSSAFLLRPCRAAVLAGLGLLFLVGPASAQTADDALRLSLREPAVGARALGMSGAGTAGWADLSALYTNPAGLGFYESSEFAGSMNLLSVGNKSAYQVGDASPFGRDGSESAVRLGSFAGVYRAPTTQGSLVLALGFTQTSTFDRTLRYRGENAQNSISQFLLPAFAEGGEWSVDEDGLPVVDPIRPFVGFAGGATEFFGGDYEAGEYPFEPAVFPGTRIVQDGTVRREGRLNELNVAGAVALAEGVMAGATANITFGRYGFENEIEEIDDFNENADYEVDGDLDGASDRFGLERITFRERFDADLTGFNLRAGLSADLTSAVRLGLTVETPTWTSVDEDFTDAFVRTEFTDGAPLTYGDDPDEDEARGTFDYSVRTPWRYGAGLAYATDRLRVTADVEFVDWSALELDSESFDFPTANETIEDDFRAVFNWRGGVEYRFDGGLAVRGGAGYRPDPRAYNITTLDGDTDDRSRTFFSLGLSHPISEQLTLDAGWMQERTQDQFQPYGSPDPSLVQNDIVDDTRPPIIDEDVIRNQFQIGVRYRF